VVEKIYKDKNRQGLSLEKTAGIAAEANKIRAE
jgi:hypothetical protein